MINNHVVKRLKHICAMNKILFSTNTHILWNLIMLANDRNMMHKKLTQKSVNINISWK